MDALSQLLSQAVSRWPWLFLCVSLALAAALTSPLLTAARGELGLPVEIDVERTFPSPESSAARRAFDRFRATFGNDEVVLVALLGEDLLTPDGLRRIERLTRRLERVDGVRRVVSLANTPDIRYVDGDVVVLPVFETVPEDPGSLEALRRRVLDHPLLAGQLVSRDGRAVAFVVHPEEMSEREFRERGLDREVARIADAERGAGETALSGVLPLKAATGRLLLADLVRFVPLSVLAMALVCFVNFRSVRGVAIPLAAVGFAQACTLGVLVLSGRSLNLVTFIVPPLVMAVGLAYTVHVVAEHDAALGEGLDARDAVREALVRVTTPVVLTALTTAAGFASLLASPLPVIREFGWLCVVGVAFSLLAALAFAPPLLALLPGRAPARVRPGDAPLARLARRMADVDLAQRTAVLAAGAALALVAVLGVARIEVSTSFLDNLASDDPMRRSIERFSERLDGSATIDVVLESEARGAFKRPRALRAVSELQRWLDAQPEVNGTASLADFVRVVNQAFNEGDRSALAIPDSPSLVAQYFAFAWHDDLERLVDRRFRTTTITVRMPHSYSSRDYRTLIERIEARLADLPEDLTGHVTGSTAMIARTVDDIARGQALSLTAALVVIYAILAAFFRSLRVAAFALVPNALPVLVYFGTLGLSGVTLNVITSLIACIILGIAVDDTVHLLARYRAELRARGGAGAERPAMRAALAAIVRPVTTTTVALALGFTVLATSGLRHQVEFGILAACMLALAWLIDMTFTPALAAGTITAGKGTGGTGTGGA